MEGDEEKRFNRKEEATTFVNKVGAKASSASPAYDA
jgi:hypothetical protein